MSTSAPSRAAFDRRLYAPMILGAMLNPINSSILAVSLVPIGREFGAPPSRTAWLVSALYLATAIGQPVTGRLIDTLGPRRLFLVGSSLTGVAGLLGATAPNLAILVVARVILGFGTCAGYPAAMYLIRHEAERTGHDSPGRVLTALAVASQTTAAVGPALGGLLIGLGGWRTTLAINVPLALACLWVGVRRLPRSPRRSGRLDVDVVGIVLFAVTFVSLLLFLTDPAAGRVWLPGVTVVAGVSFVARERRTADPFIDLRLLGGNRPLVRTYARTLLAQLVAYSFLYGYTQWLEDGRGLSASVAGLVLLPVFGVGILVSTVTGRSPQIRGKLIVGAATQLLAIAALFLLGGDSMIWLLVALAVLVGIPQGINNLANQNAVYRQAPAATIAASAGLLRTAAYTGAIGSSAASGALLGTTADTAGLHRLAIFMAVAAVLFLVLTLADRALAHVAPTGKE